MTNAKMRATCRSALEMWREARQKGLKQKAISSSNQTGQERIEKLWPGERLILNHDIEPDAATSEAPPRSLFE
jgi:hypothetical protein